MNQWRMRERTMVFAVESARAANLLLDDLATRHAAGQLARSSASVGANYRAAGLARSRREFIAKIGVVIEEADECLYWLDYVSRVRPQFAADLASLRSEAHQLVKIFTATRATARRNARLEK